MGADVLRWMALAQAAFAMLGIATTVLTSLGREGSAALVTFGAVLAVAATCGWLVPQAEFGHPQLVRSTLASGAALLAALVAAGGIVRMRTGAFVPALTALRVSLALAACVALGLVMPRWGALITPVVAVAVGVGYVLLLTVTREIGPADLAMVRSLLGRSKTAR
jgi:O-antigen/teichoic acid export membrane protein